MSHYTVAVITSEEGKTVEELLSQFDESIEVAPYIRRTKKQLIQREREDLEYTKGRYEEYIKDKDKYIKERCSTPEHIDFLDNEFIKVYNMSDDELFEKRVKSCYGRIFGMNMLRVICRTKK